MFDILTIFRMKSTVCYFERVIFIAGSASIYAGDNFFKCPSLHYPTLSNITYMFAQGQELIRLDRPFNCCVQEMEVQSPPGTLIGRVQQDWDCCELT